MKIEPLLQIMARLRNPETGCPWDIEQNFKTIAPYTIEEAYEVADAIARDDLSALKEELGDLLLQVVFHSQMATEQQAFDFEDVVAGICEKLIRRHPHVFPGGSLDSVPANGISAAQVSQNWDAIKSAEKGPAESILDGVTNGLPSMMRALKLQKQAAKVGFDWPTIIPVMEKIEEEVKELAAEIHQGGSIDAIEDELGDVLFCCVNLARHAGLDPETTLARTNLKFERRFKGIEKLMRQDGVQFENLDLEKMDQYWNQVKLTEKK